MSLTLETYLKALKALPAPWDVNTPHRVMWGIDCDDATQRAFKKQVLGVNNVTCQFETFDLNRNAFIAWVESKLPAKLDLTKPLRHRVSGSAARIIYSERKGAAPYVVLVNQPDPDAAEAIQAYSLYNLETWFENIPEPPALPHLPSALLRIALDDLAKTEADPAYSIRMSNWHAPDGNVCNVCLAGSVIAKSLGVAPTESLIPSTKSGLKDEDRKALIALDYFRMGEIDSAYVKLGRTKPTDLPGTIMVTEYSLSSTQFRADIERMIKILEAYGE